MYIEVVHGNATLNQATITFHFSRILMIKLHSPLEQHNSTLQMWYRYTYYLPPDVIGSEYNYYQRLQQYFFKSHSRDSIVIGVGSSGKL